MLQFQVHYTVTSGWKTWENEDATEANGGGEGEPFSLYLWTTGPETKEGETRTVYSPIKWSAGFDTGGIVLGISMGTALATTMLQTLF